MKTIFNTLLVSAIILTSFKDYSKELVISSSFRPITLCSSQNYRITVSGNRFTVKINGQTSYYYGSASGLYPVEVQDAIDACKREN